MPIGNIREADMRSIVVGVLVLTLALCSFAGTAWSAEEAAGAETYVEVSQADLSKEMEKFAQKKVSVTGPFLFTGSDFCVNIRKTKINTKDYFCFALGPISLVRFYLHKKHEQAMEIINVKRGAVLKIDGTYDYLGQDYKYVVVDKFEIVE